MSREIRRPRVAASRDRLLNHMLTVALSILYCATTAATALAEALRSQPYVLNIRNGFDKSDRSGTVFLKPGLRAR
ncbi:uncharacterized protein PG986_013784 [Apiospora aurea]|uniref:Uncharacterized protein n=1 Tax=Apiospora aurea TaxID=335848 RepID=A0ABR1PWI6_9PEZI